MGDETSRQPVDAADHEIGRRVKRVRKRRGLPLEQAAGLAGIGKSYLSRLENGQRRFTRRGLIDDLAEALSCSVSDLTGEPFPAPDRRTQRAMDWLPHVEAALMDCTLDDVPDAPARPVQQLAAAVDRANRLRDQTDYAAAGDGLGALITELQITAATGTTEDRHEALKALAELQIVTYEMAKNLGHPHLAYEAVRRGAEAARRTADPALIGFSAWYTALALMRLGARRRAATTLAAGLAELEPHADPTMQDTTAAETYGLMHLTSALHAARAGRSDDAHAHLDEADLLAGRAGEPNSLRQHFGPTNVAVWRVSIGVELGLGAKACEGAERIDVDLLGSRNRKAALHADIARAYVQEGGRADPAALRHLDLADRIAPARVRLDPLARDMVMALDQRARRTVWELDSLKRRIGVA